MISVWSRVEHLDGHAADVPRREELTAVASEVGADDLFVGLALDVDFAVEERVRLELGDDVREHARLELDRVVLLEDRAVLLLHG